MLSRLPARFSTFRDRTARALAHPRLSRERFRSLGQRLLHFWIVWSLLLFVHEAGHLWMARTQDLEVRRITVGVGPVVWRGEQGGTQTVLRLVPVAGLTQVEEPASDASDGRWTTWRRQSATLTGGILATFAVVLMLAGIVAVGERGTGRLWLLGRFIIADALVLTVFNLLPVPPLDGGRALLSTVAALRGAPLSSDALFWFHVGGLALAIVPMALWTSWTRHIDRAALRWCAPPSKRESPATARAAGDASGVGAAP